MPLFRHNYVSVLFWTVAIICPLLLERAGVLSEADLILSPRNGYTSIITGQFLHGSWGHAVGNLILILLGSSLLYQYYNKSYLRVTIWGLLAPGTFMYYLGKPTLGISALGFAMIWFVVARGLMSRDISRFKIALFMIAFYGVTVFTAIPQSPMSRIAWEGHLAGLLVGVILAAIQRMNFSKIK